MQFIEAISGPDGQNLIRLAQGLDLKPEEATAVLGAILPEISRNLERETLSRGGLAQIIQQLGDPAQKTYLDEATDLTSDEAIAHGNDILGSILHTKYRSRALADFAEKETGVPAAKVRKMLPRVANVSMAALQQQTRSGLEEIFRKMPGLPNSEVTRTAPPSNNNSPLPLPDDNWGGQSRNGYDDLSDVLRRRQRPFQSNPLWTIARQILGSVLGFKTKGIIGYIIRFIIYRYGWSLLRMIFGRLFRV